MAADNAHTVLALTSRVPSRAAGTALLDYLLQRFRYHDRTAWLAEFAQGRLLVDGDRATPGLRLRSGAQVTYLRMHAEPPVETSFTIVHADAELVVVDKPAHLPMHADGPFVRHTLVHLLREHLHAADLQLVHRLDRETSGLCVVAKTATARASLQGQFAAGTVAKGYLAVVRGNVARNFVVDQPIGRAATSLIALRRSAAPQSLSPQSARTSFEVLGSGADRSLLRCLPDSGRTHQIRVHLEHVDLPILGDKLYGHPDEHYLAFVANVKSGGSAKQVPPGEPHRQLLHANALAFDHPQTHQRLQFSTALPRDFEPWLTEVTMLERAPSPQ